MRISAPSALAWSRLCWEPGTRMTSPKVVRITLAFWARAMASSNRPLGMMQTGQPGPWTSSTVSGNRDSNPYLKMEWVWPPQTSITLIGPGRDWVSC
jgi:hypothetical protein